MNPTKRLLYILIPVVITVLMVFPLMKARINPDLNEYLPKHTPAKMNIEKVEALFGKKDPAIMIMKADDVLEKATLVRIRNITDTLLRMAEIKEVISLFETRHIRGEGGMMLVDPAIGFIPETDEEKEALRADLKENPLAWELLISEDSRYTLFIITPADDLPDETFFGLLHDVLKKYPGDEEVYFSGMPYLRYEIQRNASRDLAILLPLGLIIMIVFFYLSFREMRGVVLPLLVVLMSVVLSIGLMPIMGFDLSLIAVLTPILMIAIANNYGVHIIARYQELNAKKPEWSMQEIVKQAVSKLSRPVIFTGLTTIVGVLGLVVHIMLPAQQMGIVCSIGIGFALLLSLTFLPAILSRLKKGTVQQSYNGKQLTVIDRFLRSVAGMAIHRSWAIIVVSVILMVLAGIGISRLKVSINNENMLPRSHNIRKATRVADTSFGGTKYVSILFEGDIKDPDVLQSMDRVEQELKKVPGVGHVTSLATVIRLMSKALHDPGDVWYDTIPGSREAIAQYIELYNMSGDPDDFSQLVDFDYTHAQLNIQFAAKTLKQFNQVIRRIETIAGSSPYSTITSGLCLVEKEMAVSIAKGQIYSLVLAILAIAVLLWIIFRSVRSGLMGCTPLLFTLVCNFGLMGWAGVELDIATSLLSSIAIGLGVDYTIHLFWRLKHEMATGKTWSDALITTLTTTGKGISINAFSVMLGFLPLFFSGLVILKSFAFLIIFSLLLCLLCAIILIPAICIVAKPSFLQKPDASDFFINHNNHNNHNNHTVSN